MNEKRDLPGGQMHKRTAQGIKPKQRLQKGNVAQKMPQKTWLTIYCNSTPVMPTNGNLLLLWCYPHALLYEVSKAANILHSSEIKLESKYTPVSII
jgi:hypothetical protein